jgi:hypothetical protein
VSAPTVETEYPSPKVPPTAVKRWEDSVLAAGSDDAAQTQLLYVLAVETRRLRWTVQFMFAVWAIMALAAVITIVVLLNQPADPTPYTRGGLYDF